MERFEIRELHQENGKLWQIIVFDNNKPDTEDDPKLIALYHYSILGSIGKNKYDSLTGWKKALEKHLNYKIDWQELKEKRILTFA